MPSRETELYKDKVEVSLDGRQIFYLFFGGAVIVGVVFVLGVLVGRRVEARGHIERARTHSATDPLAALDRLEGSGGMAFRGALTGQDTPSPVDAVIEKKAAEKKAEEPKVEKKAAEKKVEEPKVEKKAEEAKVEKKAEDKKVEKKTDKEEGPVTKPDADKSAAVEPEKKQKFTLQLSSFQDKSEAEAFLSTVKEKGYTASITQAEVEGKGTFYRVRMGTYRSMEAAATAKEDFEKSFHKSASVMKL